MVEGWRGLHERGGVWMAVVCLGEASDHLIGWLKCYCAAGLSEWSQSSWFLLPPGS